MQIKPTPPQSPPLSVVPPQAKAIEIYDTNGKIQQLAYTVTKPAQSWLSRQKEAIKGRKFIQIQLSGQPGSSVWVRASSLAKLLGIEKKEVLEKYAKGDLTSFIQSRQQDITSFLATARTVNEGAQGIFKNVYKEVFNVDKMPVFKGNYRKDKAFKAIHSLSALNQENATKLRNTISAIGVQLARHDPTKPVHIHERETFEVMIGENREVYVKNQARKIGEGSFKTVFHAIRTQDGENFAWSTVKDEVQSPSAPLTSSDTSRSVTPSDTSTVTQDLSETAIESAVDDDEEIVRQDDGDVESADFLNEDLESSNIRGAQKESQALQELHAYRGKRGKIPNLAPAYQVTAVLTGNGEVVQKPQQLILIQQLLDGTAGSLNDMDQIRQVAQDAAEALSGMHEAGHIHVDVKPDNILFEKIPDGQVRGRLHDFGCAVPKGKLGIGGSPGYMAPEALHRELLAQGQYAVNPRYKADPKFDSFSMGMSLFEMITGKMDIVDNKGKLLTFNTLTRQEDVDAILRQEIQDIRSDKEGERYLAALEKEIQIDLNEINLQRMELIQLKRQKGIARQYDAYPELDKKIAALNEKEKGLKIKLAAEKSKIEKRRAQSPAEKEFAIKMLEEVCKGLLTLDPAKRLSCETAANKLKALKRTV